MVAKIVQTIWKLNKTAAIVYKNFRILNGQD